MKASAIRVVGLTVVVGLSIVLLAYHLWSTDGLFVVPAFGGGPQSAIAPSRPRLHFLFPATQMGPLGCKSLLSALLNNFEPILLNFGSQQSGTAARLLKVQGVRDYLDRNVSNPDDLIFMADAFDVWYQQPAEILIDRFMEDPSRVLISADKKCWPEPANSAECDDVPQSPLPAQAYGEQTDTGGWGETTPTTKFNRPRWANSGTILGLASQLQPLYCNLTELAKTRGAQFDDQGLFITYYYDSPNKPITIDLMSDFFQTLTFSRDDVAFMASPHHLDSNAGASAVPPLGLPANPPLLRNKISGSLPVVLHFNGEEKSLMSAWSLSEPSWWSRMWYVSGGPGSAAEQAEVKAWVRERVRAGGATVAETGEFLSWEKLGCEREDVWGELLKQ